MLALTAFLAVGLIWNTKSETVPVTGIVVYPDGRPVGYGMIEFSPEDGRPSARSKIGTDGRFTLITGEKPGAVPGRHKIVVVQMGAANPAQVGHKHKGLTVDRVYSRYETSGLARDVQPDQPNEFTIEVDATR
jgi:hypothetical protein